MLLTCVGCSTSISDLEGDISCFTIFIILVANIHKVQICLASFALIGGPLRVVETHGKVSVAWPSRYNISVLLHRVDI